MSCDDSHGSWEQRLEERLRQLGTREPACSVAGCPERNPFALTGVHPGIVCYEHRAERAGRPWLERHHPPGQHNDSSDVADAPGNDHRVLNGRQSLWPQETLRNPDGSPLLRAAAALRGWLDVLWLIMTRTVGWIPEYLERLDAWLRDRLGERWWDEFRRSG
jgi:hypothetical protein